MFVLSHYPRIKVHRFVLVFVFEVFWSEGWNLLVHPAPHPKHPTTTTTPPLYLVRAFSLFCNILPLLNLRFIKLYCLCLVGVSLMMQWSKALLRVVSLYHKWILCHEPWLVRTIPASVCFTERVVRNTSIHLGSSHIKPTITRLGVTAILQYCVK